MTILGDPDPVSGELWSFTRSSNPGYITSANFAARSALQIAGFILSFGALALGATGVGKEFSPTSAEFLLTRPRRRRYFVWSAWAFGAFEVLILLFASLSAALLVVAYKTFGNLRGYAAELIPGLFVCAMVFFGISYFFTMWLRDGHKGMNVALLAVLGYILALIECRKYWKLHLPSMGFVFSSYYHSNDPYPFLALLGWTALAIVFPFAAQWILERRDI